MVKINEQVHFLLVDDDEDHAEFVQNAFDQSGTDSRITPLHDGVEALSYLRREPEFVDAERVDVVLLDISMPGLSGHEVLREIRKDPRMNAVPVVILTSSDSEEDRRRAYEAHANSYIIKPFDIESFNDVITRLDEYWSRCCALPPNTAGRR